MLDGYFDRPGSTFDAGLRQRGQRSGDYGTACQSRIVVS